ncbi:MAG: hypothetical protein HKN00_02050 [Flavobacteriaceae bacterium]|nr:hypothetical protein [Bacteroidia bacterium]MBT8287706.1 hypothetical protein [Bacteroidia bacterium]NNF73937.1 hypothetical protein [Flavobacteriaceae bacterium]NNK71702.1 hypothetical protein [Flavobacteriaceae bacterium]
MKLKLAFLCILTFSAVIAQDKNTLNRTIKVAAKDSIVIDTLSINPIRFQVSDINGRIIDSSQYKVDFQKARLILLNQPQIDSLIIDYALYPDFITRTYSLLNTDLIIEDTKDLNTLYRLSQSTRQMEFTPFDGLTTSGSISRGITIGNNQNSVLNSELDLQISGKLNDEVSLRASIQDANIPLQESGYSQRLDEFDQVFIEVFSKNWNIRAGDIDLVNNNSYYARFSKRVQGLQVQARLDHPESKTDIFASGALVRGQFARSRFVAQEGNQGPYKLKGSNGELFVLIVSGSESVYVNGVLVERGENKDYIIDYNAGEIIFNSTFPISSEMRITVDYQFSDRNYSRFVAFGGMRYQTEKLNIGVSVYNENDAKNQPLQQNLSNDQVQILANAGDDQSLMTAPSASPESFNENRILYRKELIDGVEAFVFSTDPNDDLFSVKFSLIGENMGNYIVSSTNAISTIYEYVIPINGVPQGRYEPVVQLISPTKLQMLILNGHYNPTDKTKINFELAGSRNDLNLFSTLDDANNDGFAGKLDLDQLIMKRDSGWTISSFAKADLIKANFRTIEPLYNAEFNRDWNLDMPDGDQRLLTGGFEMRHQKKGIATYAFENLNYSRGYNGNKHNANLNLTMNRLRIFSASSFLKSTSTINSSSFTRSFNRLTYSFNKAWVGSKLSLEDNEQRNIQTDSLTELSQKFLSYEFSAGVGDSTNVYFEMGMRNRMNDSIRSNKVQRVNNSNTYFIRSRLIKNQNSNLALFVNYRTLNFSDSEKDKEQSLNSRLQYSQNLFKRLIQLNTVYETNSGSLPQQDFTYIEVEAGQGAYTWIDYNGNGVQELEEFEVAQFQDQGSYIRVLLPNQVFIKTHQNRFSQNITINPRQLLATGQSAETFLTKFYNQTAYLIDRKIRRDGNNFNLNPFDSNAEDQLGLQQNFRNTLFFNRGKQRYTTSYSFLANKSRSVLSVGFIQNRLTSHQIDFNHKIRESWLITLQSASDNNRSESENFTSKNFDIDEFRINPKLTYLFNDRIRVDVFYQFSNQENTIGNSELLKQQKYGVSFAISDNQNATLNGEFNYFSNDFNGDPNSPVGYQMMKGLQPGTNFTWTLLAQKRITKFLDLNVNYFGRKSENSRTIHTGSVQLKAYF